MPVGIYKRTKQHCNNISLANKGPNGPHNGKRGYKSSHWKGGKIINGGYKLIKTHTHPFRLSNNYIALHRLIVEKYLSRYVTKKERVHHIDKNKLNNQISNIMVFKNSSVHTKYHKNPKNIKKSDIIFNGREL